MMNKEIFVEKQASLAAQELSFEPGEISFNKDDIGPRSVICVGDDYLVVEEVAGEKVRCIDLLDDGFRVVKLSEDIAVIGSLIV